MVEYLFQQGEISKGAFRKGAHLKIMDTNGVQGIEVDLFDHHTLHDAMEGVDIVYNLASPMPGEDNDFLKVNTEGLLNLLEAAAEAKAKAVVHLSTLDVFGFRSRSVGASAIANPSDDYQKAKAEAERLLGEFSRRNAEPRIAVIRAAKAVGSRDESFVVPVLKMAEMGRVTVPSPAKMSFTHPRDIAQAMYKAALGKIQTGRKFNVMSFDATPGELAQGIVSAVGKEAEVRRPGFFSGSTLPRYTTEQLNASLRLDEQPEWNELGYAPAYSLQSTCEEIATWYKRSPWVTESA